MATAPVCPATALSSIRVCSGILEKNCNILQNISNISSHFFPDPCTPHNLSASVNCDMRIVSLSWDGRNGTNVYMVSAEAANRTSSLTTNGTTAHFSDLSCGQNYSLTVAPHSQYCPGTTGTPASIQTCRSNGTDEECVCM